MMCGPWSGCVGPSPSKLAFWLVPTSPPAKVLAPTVMLPLADEWSIVAMLKPTRPPALLKPPLQSPLSQTMPSPSVTPTFALERVMRAVCESAPGLPPPADEAARRDVAGEVEAVDRAARRDVADQAEVLPDQRADELARQTRFGLAVIGDVGQVEVLDRARIGGEQADAVHGRVGRRDGEPADRIAMPVELAVERIATLADQTKPAAPFGPNTSAGLVSAALRSILLASR